MTSKELKKKIEDITITDYELNYDSLDEKIYVLLENLIAIIEGKDEEIKKLENSIDDDRCWEDIERERKIGLC